MRRDGGETRGRLGSERAVSGTDIGELLGVLALIVTTGFFAMSETAIIRTNRARAYRLAEEKRRGSASLLKIVENVAPYLNVVLLLTLLATIGGTTLAQMKEPAERSDLRQHAGRERRATDRTSEQLAQIGLGDLDLMAGGTLREDVARVDHVACSGGGVSRAPFIPAKGAPIQRY